MKNVRRFAAAMADMLERDYWGLISPDSFRNVAEGKLTPEAEPAADKLSVEEAADEAAALSDVLAEALRAIGVEP